MLHCVASLSISHSIHISLSLLCPSFFLSLLSAFFSPTSLFLPLFHFLSLCLSVLLSLSLTEPLCLCHFLPLLTRYIQMEVKDRALHYSNPSQEQESVTMTGKFPLKQAIYWDNKWRHSKAGKRLQHIHMSDRDWGIFLLNNHIFHKQNLRFNSLL